MKKTLKALALAAAALSMSACGHTPAPASQVSVSQDPAQFAQAYYESWFTSATVDTLPQMEKVLAEYLDGKDATQDSIDIISSLPAEDQKALADRLTEVNPMASMYDTEGMAEHERALLQVVATGFPAAYHTGDQVSVQVDGSQVTTDDGVTKVPYSAVTIKVADGEPVTAQEGQFYLPLKQVGQGWKVDGKAFYDMVLGIADAVE